ncbi:hypothetical protein BN961_02129 [Afipia felis]|uniref:Uncharacterized protein n=1 Tax=Afipia felis TaxID=1035 RepID=A0A090MMU8_AFIFE|nr:hypothetical protein [Afipia felis]CEG08711.1 hypothetical protein BN961_02129 [Afipia felis]
MSTPVIRVKVTPKSVIKGKMDVRFPASVSASSPIILTKSGGSFAFGFDMNAVVQSVTFAGFVSGPAASTSGNIATFNGTGGTVIQDGGKSLPSGTIVGTSDNQTLTNKTITSPVLSGTVSGTGAIPSDVLANTSVTAGSYTSANITVNAQGQITAASNGSGGGTGREVLAANRTYYVLTTGSDSNNGLANTSGGAFLTIAKALSAVSSIDLNGFTATIQVGPGTWTGNINLPKIVGGSAVLLGDETTPSNVILSASSNWCVSALNINCTWDVRGFKLTSTGSSVHGLLGLSGNINYQNIEFGSCTGSHVWAGADSLMTATAGTSISGGAQWHWYAESGGAITDRGVTITLTGTPAFSASFAEVRTCAIISVGANTFIGSATGKKYNATSCGAIEVYGAGTSYLPGSAAGTGTNPGASPYGIYV